MKKILTILFALCTISFSCEDLEVVPRTGTPANLTFTDGQAFKEYLAKLYASLSLTGQNGPAGDTDLNIIADEGFTSYIRAYWKANQLPTDETVIAWTDAGIQDLNTLTWSSENQFIRVLYYRIYYTIALSNDFLEQSTEDRLIAYDVPEEDWDEINTFRAEARFLRALCYWHALDFFREVPLITRISAQNPEQETAQTIFNFIESELNEIENRMIAPQENEYGRADRAALWMLRAKLYLNAEVYTGTPRWSDALADVNSIINDGGYSLTPNYRELFMADNGSSAARNELIFTLPADGVNSQSWGSTTFLVHAAISANSDGPMVDSDYGVEAGWGGIRATPTFVSVFDDISGNTDTRANFFTAGQQLEVDTLTQFSNGYAVPKYTNKTSTGGDGADGTHVDTDYPMFRLADAYLMYAELVLRGAGGDQATALNLINELRQRAYGDNSGNITAGELTLDFILDERSRELHWEATRRIDLIRFDAFNNGIWAWKGGVKEGQATAPHLQFFPIPATELTANPNMKQNSENY